ncbi:response regulator receiver domain [Nannocystis punicea]|uniref:Response regulator receiver domain n=1 Tax=Nannocystis punicea TaxID=2995304 RepID=A0ABY7H683_9BACT|nr:response regulator receiver domain [Nannocystis poenicansa]WAS94534.1 response regulator receiver domain [Nannocystis poenicansa]
MNPQQKKAYIDPIRTVMLVDEQFLNVAEMAQLLEPPTKPPGSAELSVGAELWKACHQRRWACDIEKGPFNSDALARIERCDLIVLDYHLDGTDDPTQSLNILKQLADSPGSNLVVVYTNEPRLMDVKLRVAATLRGARDAFDEKVTETLDDLESGDAFSQANIWQFLALDPAYKEEIGGRLKGKVDEAIRKDVIDGLIERYLAEELGAPTGSVREISCSRTESDPHWVHCGNVFVAIVGKPEAQGGAVIAKLERAIEDWDPPPLVTTMAYTRHRIAEGGFKMDVKFLSENPALHAGWLHRSSSRGTRELVEQVLFESADRVLDDVATFSQSLALPSGSGKEESKFAAARRAARAPSSISDRDVCLALNAFLCSEKFARDHVTTGTVFREVGGSRDVYWICATPACDMVVRPNAQKVAEAGKVSREPAKKASPEDKPPRWVKELESGSIRAVMVLRGIAVPDAGLDKCLTNATKLKHIFLHDVGLEEDGVAPLRAIEVLAEDLSVEQMYAADLAIVKNRRFRVFRVSADQGKVELKGIEMMVVGQLRKQYAARLLQASGHHGSRIGIDFENLFFK